MCQQSELMSAMLAGYPVLIGGVAGSGKTVLMQEIFKEVQRNYTPDEAKVLLLLGRPEEWISFAASAYMMKPVTEDAYEALDRLEWLLHEAKHRMQHHQSTPRIIAMADEYASMMRVDACRTEMLLKELTIYCRKVGIQLVFSTLHQQPMVMTGMIRALFPCRAAFRVATPFASVLMLDASGAEELKRAGDMLLWKPGDETLRKMHVPITQD